jgi:hypothetical protein
MEENVYLLKDPTKSHGDQVFNLLLLHVVEALDR